MTCFTQGRRKFWKSGRARSTDLKRCILMANWIKKFCAAPTTPNSPELIIRFIDSCIQWSVVLYLGWEPFRLGTIFFCCKRFYKKHGIEQTYFFPRELYQTKAIVHNKLASFSFTLSDISYDKEVMCNVHSTQTFGKIEFNLNLCFRPIFVLT